jgi:hypothetical protein
VLDGDVLARSFACVACLAVAACSAARIQVAGAVPVHARPAFSIVLDPRTIASATIPAHHGFPQVTLLDVPAMLAATLGAPQPAAPLVVRLAVTAIDFDASSAGDVRLAHASGAWVQLAHGGGEIRGPSAPPMPHYARIVFAAELVRDDLALAHINGSVSGSVRVGSSERDVREALGSALDQLISVLDRSLIAPRTAATTSRCRCS